MTLSSDVSAVQSPQAVPGVRPRARATRRWQWVAGLALVVACIATVLVVVDRDRPLDEFDAANSIGTSSRTAIGEPVHVGLGVWPRERPVTVRHVVPVTLSNTADATLTVRVCAPGPEGPPGSVRGDVGRWCPGLTEVSGHALWRPVNDSGGYAPAVVLTVTPRRPGMVHVTGVQITYEVGGRTETETTGMDVVLRTDERCRGEVCPNG